MPSPTLKKMNRLTILVTILIISALASATPLRAQPQAEYRALLIGISDYAPAGPGGPDLNYADDDANDWYFTLTSEHGWRPNNIIKLIDSEASKTAIQGAIGVLAGELGPNDLFLLFYAGHGAYTPDQPPLDEIDGFDEYILAHDLEKIIDDELASWLTNIKAGRIVAIFDSCFSGGFIKSSSAGIASDMEIRTLPTLEHRKLIDTMNGDLAKPGYIVLTACDDDEICAESSALQNGIFTYYMIEGMTSHPFPADFDGDSKVSAEEDYIYAAPKATAFNPNQHAQQWDGILGEAELTIIYPPTAPVGGVLLPVNKLAILAPYIGLVGGFGALTAAVLKGRRRK